MLNPFFLHGSASEQRLVQDLINEQLKMFGVDVYYMPRKFLGSKTVMKENVLARFDDNFIIEAYLQNYEGFAGSGDLMTKFGIRTTDELTLVISKERYDDFVASFYDTTLTEEVLVARPKEGDLIYLPLTDSLFEIKFVEHENPFYQLGKLYMYELKCELFEYEDEVINTSIEEIDDNVQDIGYIANITFVGAGETAAVTAGILTGAVNQIIMINDGYGYTSPPAVAISTSPAGITTANATVLAITTTAGAGSTTFSIKEVQITNPGFGYTQPPTVTFSGAGGVGAVARAGIATEGVTHVVNSSISTTGSNYVTAPVVSISTSPAGLSTANATAVAIVGTGGTISAIRFTNAGFGYTIAPTITIADPASAGIATGNFFINEVIRGESSLSTARVKSWDIDTKVLKISNIADPFRIGEVLTGTATTITNPGMANTGRYVIQTIQYEDKYDQYAENIVIESEADNILDFTETNPFGNF